MAGILVIFHCESDPGFAAASHELTFLEMARRLVGNFDDIHFAYSDLSRGRSPSLPAELKNVIQFNWASGSKDDFRRIQGYVDDNAIRVVFGFDLPVRNGSYKYLRRGGVQHIISYLGAPMSGKMQGLKLALKKIDVLLARHRPDHFIFQSEGMRETGVQGRGIPREATSLVRTGIDVERFSPSSGKDWYAHEAFGIDKRRKIVFFSGHMEERKGVDVTIKAARHLVEKLDRVDFHLLILGNRNGQERRFLPLFEGSAAENHITFGGYRSDVPSILKSCSLGFIASTGWDSFPMSSIEMAASGMPLIISDLPGLREAVTPETGMLYPPGDYRQAASCIALLLDNGELRRGMGRQARQRVVNEFSVDRQIAGLESVVRRVTNSQPRRLRKRPGQVHQVRT